MQLTEADIAKYQELYKQYTGQDIEYEKAVQFAQRLVRLVQMIYRPITKEEFEKYNPPQEKI